MSSDREAYNRGAHCKDTGRGVDYCEEPSVRLRIWWMLGFQDAGKKP
jgi:hypothetical protein